MYNGLTPRQKCSQCILQSQPTEPHGTRSLVLTLCLGEIAKAFVSIHRQKMEQILLANGLPARRNRRSHNDAV